MAGQQHRLQVLRRALSPGGAQARLLIRAAIAGRLRRREQRKGGYRRWIELFDQLTPDDRQEIAQIIAGGALPTINVVWALRPEDRRDDVVRLLRSLQAQMLGTWTATILVAADREAELANDAVFSDPRVRISESLPGLPREHLLLLFSPGVLPEHALFMFALAAAQGAEVAYADSDRIDGAGARTSPAFRSDFSPTLARQTNFFGPCIYLRAPSRLADVDVRKELDVSHALAGCERASVMHLARVLFHQSVEREPASTAADVGDAVRSVSIIIPTRDHVGLLQQCIDSIRQCTDYPANLIEIIVVDNGSIDLLTLDYLRELGQESNAQVIRDDAPFNYSRLNNLAARRANGDVLVLLNNDILIDDPKWLRRLVSYAAMPDVGAVGGKLLYPDRTVQHGGVVFGIGGGARHAQVGLSENDPGYLRSASLDRETAAVTGACLAMRRELFTALGGLDENLNISFNDATLCAEALRRGYRNVCIATPLAIHFESKSRGLDDTPERMALARSELVYAMNRYRDLFRHDPFYSANLSADGAGELAFPPRVAKPWRSLGRQPGQKLRVLLLGDSGLGADIAAVLNAQVHGLIARGHEVIVGSAKSWRVGAAGCRQIVLRGADDAAEFAVRNAVDCVVVHNAPFFSIAMWLGAAAKLVAMDHVRDARGEAEAIVAYNRFWRAWADSIVTVEEGAMPAELAPLLEELMAPFSVLRSQD